MRGAARHLHCLYTPAGGALPSAQSLAREPSPRPLLFHPPNHTSLRGKKHVVQEVKKACGADKQINEALRYYNGLAEAKGAKGQAAQHGFDSSNVQSAWPSAGSGEGAGGGGAAAYAAAPPAGSVPGIRSRTLEGLRRPVATHTGAFAYPAPGSPGKSRARQQGAAADGSAGGGLPSALANHLCWSSAGISTAEGAPVAGAAAQHTGKMAAPHVHASKLAFSDAGLTATEEAASGGRALSSRGGALGAFNRAGVDAVAALGAPVEVVATTEARYMRTVAPLPKGGKMRTAGAWAQQKGGDMAECMRG